MAINLVKHAISMILNNLSEAFRASLLPLVILILVTVTVGGSVFAFSESLEAGGEISPDMNVGAVFSAAIIVLVAYLVVFGWLAVTWHRYILLGDEPGFVPAIQGKNIGAYIGTLIMIGLILIGAGLAVSLVVGIIASAVPFLGAFLIAGAAVLIGIGYLRIAIVLPAVAVGERLTFREAWERTKPHAATFAGIFFLLLLLRIVMALPGFAITAVGLNLVGTIVDLLASWFTLMVGVGILTTLYGHIVEGRPLD